MYSNDDDRRRDEQRRWEEQRRDEQRQRDDDAAYARRQQEQRDHEQAWARKDAQARELHAQEQQGRADDERHDRDWDEWRKQQAARSGALAARKELGVLLGGRHCLLDLTQLGEIVIPAGLQIQGVPLAQDWYLGLAAIRGRLTGVVDLARYMGEPACAPGSHCRIILMQNMRSQRGGLNRPPFFCTCDRADAQEGT